MEIWKDVIGYEGYYQVSNKGNVRSLDRYVQHKIFGKKFCKGHLMALHETNAGYLAVNLCKNNIYTTYDVHRLVAIAFIQSKDPDGLQVNHKDENKHNNSVGNLEWCTVSYNNLYGTKNCRTKEKLEKSIIQFGLDGSAIKEFSSATSAEREISGKATGSISHCLSGKTKTAYGYMWKFKE